MLLVIAYDVNTETKEGAKRLRKVAQLCEKYGVRVQNSVFEVLIDASQLAAFKNRLGRIIDVKTDSVRIYRLGNTYQSKIETLGREAPVESGQPLLL